MLNFLSDAAALGMVIFLFLLFRYIFKDYSNQTVNPKPKHNIIGKDIDLHGKSLR